MEGVEYEVKEPDGDARVGSVHGAQRVEERRFAGGGALRQRRRGNQAHTQLKERGRYGRIHACVRARRRTAARIHPYERRSGSRGGQYRYRNLRIQGHDPARERNVKRAGKEGGYLRARIPRQSGGGDEERDRNRPHSAVVAAYGHHERGIYLHEHEDAGCGSCDRDRRIPSGSALYNVERRLRSGQPLCDPRDQNAADRGKSNVERGKQLRLYGLRPAPRCHRYRGGNGRADRGGVLFLPWREERDGVYQRGIVQRERGAQPERGL